ncbi:hypothetical protein I316_01957 [Kwoniella heveanensis BCC8398]|uniref:Uncharacterized protein n=1 Tax=Kwoniella heveanensis BCC8398 TaxID=1296120 RepID=A0A1B9GYN7_9TREE|nr:hypothetical protein I316_01957 [Kwoniella heveanensis BCC8398]
MSGFILGTGSGILASAAVYYTLSTSLRDSTAALRSELHHSSNLLTDSFDPVAPPAPSSLVGPRYPYEQSFSSILRQRWNETLTSLVGGVRTTDWTAVGKGVWEAGQGVVERVSETIPSSASTPGPSTPLLGSNSGFGSPVAPVDKTHSTVAVVPGTTGVVDHVEKAPEVKVSSTAGVDLRRDSYGMVGGNDTKEEIKRKLEATGMRLV